MRYLFLSALLCILPISVFAQTARDWADRLTDNDAKVRATAEAALVQRGDVHCPLLRRFIHGGVEELQLTTLEIIRRIGPAIPLLVELLRYEQLDIRHHRCVPVIGSAGHGRVRQRSILRALLALSGGWLFHCL